ncbi:MAG TPA: aldehyde dehydrogenase family protein [Aggregatilineales bacterium]|nr:aldehyde dehydrogenase family protein [Aggregatilineales bacterium]
MTGQVKMDYQAKDYQTYFAGEWRESESGRRFAVYSPVTGEQIGTVPEGSRADVQQAVHTAGNSWQSWAKKTAFERAAILENAAGIVTQRRDEMAYILTLEQGKPLHHEAYVEVDEVIAYLRMVAADVTRLEGHIVASTDPQKRVFVTRVPRGVVGAISPWNWPYTMPVELIVPALGTGNAVVWACAPTTSITAIMLAGCLVDAGIPKGVFNLLTGYGAVVGDEIAVNPGVHTVGFIGSVATGMQVARQAAGKELLLELGGNGPLIILEDADLDRAVDATLLGSFLCAGQSCTAAELILVHESVKKTYLEKLLAKTREKIHLGDPFQPQTTMGPLQNAKTAEKMDAHIRDAVARGARIAAGGSRAQGFPTDLYYQPTILDHVNSDMIVSGEETFGPIVPVQTIRSDAEAVEIATRSGYGLTIALFTEDLRRGMLMAEELRSGTVVINDSTNWFEYHIAFGGGAGTKSGFGRVGGRFGYERFTELKTIFVDMSHRKSD